jgi:cytochrome c peroxidase
MARLLLAAAATAALVGGARASYLDVDYGAVYAVIAGALRSDPAFDDGSFGPILIRLAFHQAATFDPADGTGGAGNASMRFPPEADSPDNAGLATARALLADVKRRVGDDLSYADLWSLAGACAVQELGGPDIPWRPGRGDQPTGPSVVPGGRLPDATDPSPAAIRRLFGRRLGFTDAQAVALIGAHSVGRAHSRSSGFTGAWTRAPTRFGVGYFDELVRQTWVRRVQTRSGKVRFTDAATHTLLMLPSDLALLRDAEYARWVRAFAASRALFFTHFAAAFARLLELGVAFPDDDEAAVPRVVFPRSAPAAGGRRRVLRRRRLQ